MSATGQRVLGRSVACCFVLLLFVQDCARGAQSEGAPAAKAQAGSQAAAPVAVDDKTISFDLGKDQKLEMVLIPAGSFTMGDANGSEDQKPAHQVTMTRPFYMSKYPVTVGQLEAVMGPRRMRFGGGPPGANPQTASPAADQKSPAAAAPQTPPESNAKAAPAESNTPAPRPPRPAQNPRNPAGFMNWESCQAFVKKLNEKFADAGGKFALPTEAQWEYACRAGTTTKYYFGDTKADANDYVWSRDVAKGTTHPVGEKKPNAWGLYDMNGNCWQWCADWYKRDYYQQSPAADPPGPEDGLARVLRGGGWNDDPLYCTSTYRNRNVPQGASNDQGCRLIFVR